MNIPQQVPAGDYTVVFHTKSEQKDEDAAGRMTRLRDVTTLTVTVREFYDMQISMDPTVENDVKTSAPGRVVRFIVNVTNAGNVPDVPTLDNHTSVRSGTDITVNEQPDMGTLDGWDVSGELFDKLDLTSKAKKTVCLPLQQQPRSLRIVVSISKTLIHGVFQKWLRTKHTPWWLS